MTLTYHDCPACNLLITGKFCDSTPFAFIHDSHAANMSNDKRAFSPYDHMSMIIVSAIEWAVALSVSDI